MEFKIIESSQCDISELKELKRSSLFASPELIKLYQDLIECDCKYATLQQNGEITALIPIVKCEDSLTSLGHLDEADLFDYLPALYKSEDLVEKLLIELVNYVRTENLKLTLKEIPLRLRRMISDPGLISLMERSTIVPICNIKNNQYVQKGEPVFKKKHRKEMRRKFNRVENAGIKFRMEDELDKVSSFSKFVEFFTNSGNPEKREFMNDKMQSFFKYFIGMPMVRFSGLYFDDKLVSILVYYDENNKRYLYNMASDIEYYEYSPGILHVNLEIKEAVNKGLDEFNFLRGGERYKFEVGANACRWNYGLGIRN